MVEGLEGYSYVDRLMIFLNTLETLIFNKLLNKTMVQCLFTILKQNIFQPLNSVMNI